MITRRNIKFVVKTITSNISVCDLTKLGESHSFENYLKSSQLSYSIYVITVNVLLLMLSSAEVGQFNIHLFF